MAPRALVRIEIWSDVEANAGTIQTVISDWSTSEETFELETGKEVMLLTMLRNSEAWSDIQHRRVLRTVLSDGSYDEWRIADVDDALSERGGESAVLPCESIRYDLGSRIIERIESDGRAHGVFTLLSLSPEEHTDFLLGFAPSYFTKGTIDPTKDEDLQYENDSPLSALSELQNLTGTEIEIERNGTTDYLVHLRTEIASNQEKAYLRQRKNVTAIRRRSKVDKLANRVYPVGQTIDGVQATMAEATWEVASVASNVIGFLGSPFAFDDQLNTYYLEKTSAALTQVNDTDSGAQTVTVADGSSISVGEKLRFKRNATGDDLTFLEDPASIVTFGQVARVVSRSDIPLIENLVANAFFSDFTAGDPDDWNDVGTPTSVTENTDELFTRFGGSSAHVVAAADGDGIVSDAIVIAPTAARPFFSAQVALFIVSGSVQFRLIDDTNSQEYPDEDDDQARSNKANVWVDRLAIEGIDLNVVASTSAKLEIKAVGGAAEFYVDAAQLEQMAASATNYNAARASVDLWNAANAYLTPFSQPLVDFDVAVLDLERAYPDDFQFDELVLGGTVQVTVDSLDLDFSTRIKTIVREKEVPGATRIVLSNKLDDLSGRLGTPGRRPREELEKDLGTSQVATFKDFRGYINAAGDLVITYRLNAPHGLSVAYAYSGTAQPTRASVLDGSHVNFATNNASSAEELVVASALAPNPEDIAYITMVAYPGAAVAGFPGEMVQQLFRVSVSGAQIADGTIIADKLTENAMGFITDIVFSATDEDTVAWTSGTIELANGQTYSISGGNTGAMAAPTFIYFDSAVSTTTLAVTTNDANAVGENIILMAYAELVSDASQDAFFVSAVGVLGINEDRISVGSVSTGILQANSVTAAKINVVSLSAVSASMGTLTAGVITAGNISISADDEQILFGSATAPLTGDGVFLGLSAGDYEFRAGDPSGDFIHWDGTFLTIKGGVSPAEKDVDTVAHTGDTVETTTHTVTIPAGKLGTDGGFRVTVAGSKQSTNGNMTLRIKLDGTTIWTRTIQNNEPGDFIFYGELYNNASASSQEGFALFHKDDGATTDMNTNTASSVVTTGAVDVTVTVQNANSADTANIRRLIVDFVGEP